MNKICVNSNRFFVLVFIATRQRLVCVDDAKL